MTKLIAKATICLALFTVLCIGNLNAQRAIDSDNGTKIQHFSPANENYFDNIESYEAFIIDPSGTIGWQYYNGTPTMNTQFYAGYTYPNRNVPKAFIVFNPNATSPPITGDPDVLAHSGNQYLACFAKQSGQNNDWLISPMLVNPLKFSFWAKSHLMTWGAERIRVGYSTTGINPEDFIMITTEPYVEVPGIWTFYEYTIPTGAKYVALNCVSNNAHFLMIDDITIEEAGDNPCPAVTNLDVVQFKGPHAKLTWTAPSGAAPTGYKIYDGDTELETVTTTTFLTGVLIGGDHLMGVAAIYSDCDPIRVKKTVNIATCDNIITGVEVVYSGDCKATVTWNGTAKDAFRGEIYNNGPMITHPGQGAGGADASVTNTTYTTLFGASCNKTDNYMLADDVTFATDVVIENIDFFAYQTNAPSTNSTLTGVYVQIYNAAPNAGGTVIWGNLTTNRMTATSYTNINRVTSLANILETDRRIMKINASIETTLPAGTYWIAYTMTGGASLTGPWTSPVTYYGQPQDHGNALALGASGTWGLMVESANPNAVYELPFVVYGEGVPTYNVYQGAELMASGIKGTTYTATVAVNQGVEIEWCVTASCLAGGESEAGCKTALCTAVDPCNSVTGATAVATCSSATISWTAPAGTGLKYKVVDENGVTLVNDYTQTTYTYTATFENEKNYKWDIYTICTTGVSEKVTVSAVADCTGAIELVNSITIYPNPSSTTVTINTKDFSKVEVYNTVGQLVEINNTGTVEVSSYNTGIYFFKVYTINNQSVIKRVVVSK